MSPEQLLNIPSDAFQPLGAVRSPVESSPPAFSGKMLAGLVGGGRKGGAVPRQKQRSSAFLEGYLNKRNTKTSKFARQWNKRWFELAGDTLTYAKSPKELTSGDICVFAVHECEMLDVKGDGTVFELRFPERELVLQASDAEEAAQWVDALQASYKASSGGRSISSSPTSALRMGNVFRSAVSSDDDDPLPHQSAPENRSVSKLSPFDLGDDNSDGKARPPSPRSLLANPAAFGKFHGDGRLFGGSAGSSPVSHGTGDAVRQNSDGLSKGRRSRGEEAEVTAVQSFEPVPPTPPQSSLRARHSSPKDGYGPTAPGSSGPEAVLRPSNSRLGARDLGDDEFGISTIRLATPQTGASGPPVLKEDENWLDEDWDEDSPKVAKQERRSKKSSKSGKSSSRSSKKKAFDSGGARAVELELPIPITETALESLSSLDLGASPPASPARNKNRSRHSEQPAPVQSTYTPGVKADDDWLEEDWDSDEA